MHMKKALEIIMKCSAKRLQIKSNINSSTSNKENSILKII